MPKTVTCVISCRGGVWEGICLDFDIAVEGTSQNEVQDRISEAVSVYREEAAKEAKKYFRK